MPQHFTRSDWGARPPEPGPGPLTPELVRGIVLHWPGMAQPIHEVPAVKAALRSWQDYHMDVKGWSDIAYQVAIDQLGNTYQLRGLRTQSGANGDTTTNERYGALLLVIAPGEQPSVAMTLAVRRTIARHRELFSSSSAILGHGQVRPEPTSCPGPAVQAAIDGGRFVPAAEVTRGPKVDHALEDLADAKATGTRATIIRRAVRLLRSLPTWRKR